MDRKAFIAGGLSFASTLALGARSDAQEKTKKQGNISSKKPINLKERPVSLSNYEKITKLPDPTIIQAVADVGLAVVEADKLTKINNSKKGN